MRAWRASSSSTTWRAAEAIRPLAAWLVEGKLKAREDVAEGLEHFPTVLARLFKGEKTGKLVLKV